MKMQYYTNMARELLSIDTYWEAILHSYGAEHIQKQEGASWQPGILGTHSRPSDGRSTAYSTTRAPVLRRRSARRFSRGELPGSTRSQISMKIRTRCTSKRWRPGWTP